MISSKKNPWNSMEEKWRDQLAKNESQPDSDVWDKINQNLNDSQNKVGPILHFKRKYYVAAALLLLSFGVSWKYFSLQNNIPKKNIISFKSPEQIYSKIPTHSAKTMNPFIKKDQKIIVNNSTPVSAILQGDVENIEIKNEWVPSSTNLSVDQPENVFPSTQKGESLANTDQSNEIWVNISINPVQENNETQATLNETMKPVKHEKRSLGSLIGKIKTLLNGDFEGWARVENDKNVIGNRIHQVANQYIKTEEIIKQKFQ